MQAYACHGLAPSAAIFQNVLATLDKSSPPEAVLSWIAKMRDAGVQPDTGLQGPATSS